MKRMSTVEGVFVAGIVFLGPSPCGAADPALTDNQITHQVHSAIVADDTLPYCAHRVKVDAKNGKVTLKGNVHNPQNKSKVEAKARAIVGAKNVDSQIVVKPTAIEDPIQ